MKRYIIFFGWGDGNVKYVEKYSEIFKDMYDYIYITCSKKDMVILNGKHIYEKISNKIDSFDNRIFIVYCFSIGGFFQMMKFLDYFQIFPLKLKCFINNSLWIFDSGPGYLNYDNMHRGFIKAGYNIETTKHYINMELNLSIEIYEKNLNSMINIFKKNKYYNKALILCSSSDDIVSYNNIIITSNLLERLGFIFEIYDFKDTYHVNHYFSKKDKYTKIVKNFIKNNDHVYSKI